MEVQNPKPKLKPKPELNPNLKTDIEHEMGRKVL